MQKTIVSNLSFSFFHPREKLYKIDKNFYDDVRYLEMLALSMGFEHEDIILFESLSAEETGQALVYGL